jgi:hypothetical protein
MHVDWFVVTGRGDGGDSVQEKEREKERRHGERGGMMRDLLKTEAKHLTN